MDSPEGMEEEEVLDSLTEEKTSGGENYDHDEILLPDGSGNSNPPTPHLVREVLTTHPTILIVVEGVFIVARARAFLLINLFAFSLLMFSLFF